ncbi:MAG TPA: Hsp20/alpha crystallin family protein [Candidatus Egerieicola pullicola]|uniref:Hsp20/alpha crystallin family protein n=1 Tax=Candidatus Egerieicola pullicola TaxID=2840775 RepID=A0A9D1AJ51_9FIRM|nr:Hsp20/alpha crystallin family protein [Candidatus Egerieicola pullicola]
MLPSIFGEDLFDDFMDFPFRTTRSYQNVHGLMQTDIRETKDGYELDVDLPGFDKKDINLELKDGYLTIKASRNEEKEDKKHHYLRKERFTGSCSRSFYVGDSVKEEDVHAKFDNGILKLSFPKEEPKRLSGGSNIAIE